MKICIQPVGEISVDILSFLKDSLSKLFGECEILKPIKVPEEAYNPIRDQFNSTLILHSLPEACDVTLGVTDVDLYAENLNFVFGEAELFGKRALISVKRLKQEFYGLPRDEELLKVRVLKEAIHEIGHVLGLTHCKGKCVMRFSNSIFDVDMKDWWFCEDCLKKLRAQSNWSEPFFGISEDNQPM